MSFTRGPGKRDTHWWKKLPNQGGALFTHVGQSPNSEPFGASLKGRPTAEAARHPGWLNEFRSRRGTVSNGSCTMVAF
jgi:hypothetical protein